MILPRRIQAAKAKELGAAHRWESVTGMLVTNPIFRTGHSGAEPVHPQSDLGVRRAVMSASRKLCAVASGGFKYREQVGKSQQMTDWLAVIDQEEIAVSFPGRDVQTHECTKS